MVKLSIKYFLDEKEKLKVEVQDILTDSFKYYKGPSYDLRRKLQIQIKGQPTADIRRHSQTIFYCVDGRYL